MANALSRFAQPETSRTPLFIGSKSIVDITPVRGQSRNSVLSITSKSPLCGEGDNCAYCVVILFSCINKPVVGAVIALIAGFLLSFSVALASFGAAHTHFSHWHGAGAVIKHRRKTNMKTKNQVLAMAGDIIGAISLVALAAVWMFVGAFAID